MSQPNSITEWEHREEERERHTRIYEPDWDLQQPLQPLTRLVAVAHIPEWGCQCVQTDVDEWDARGCPEHGNPETEREAAEIAAYYSGPSPFDEVEITRKPAARETADREVAYGD